ncbi:MAG TPA: hypothetical protein VEZ11_18935 [Thermoanaerobaculia bacterium]|nr:hypothetical protein [Thermoanaerobaculia bacterium]
MATVPVNTKEIDLSKPQASATKRQREQAKREKQRVKAERRALRKSGVLNEPDEAEPGAPAQPELETPQS